MPSYKLHTYKCREILLNMQMGVTCNYEDSAETEDELMEMIRQHIASEHNIKNITPEMAAKIKKAIKK